MQKIQHAASTVKEVWEYQPPVIHTWFLASSVSIMVMFAILCLG